MGINIYKIMVDIHMYIIKISPNSPNYLIFNRYNLQVRASQGI